MAVQAKDLFQKALEKNPNNDSSQIGLGSTYFFGAAGGGITHGRHSTHQGGGRTRFRQHLYAQFMLAYGGVLSGQFDKAIERLLKVVEAEPTNSEAVFLLAEAYEQKGDEPTR